MEPFHPLRVLIVGQQNNFHHVLFTNLQHWGYDVARYSSDVLCQEATQREKSAVNMLAEWHADVLLYDLDDVVDASGLDTSANMLSILKEKKQFLIALSSRSISRRTLEHIGAVALLQKPFEMGRLFRYLHVLHQLLYPNRAQIDDNGDMAHGSIRVLVVDDDINVASVIRQCLTADEETVFDVAVAHDGLDALECCIQWHPHCIVTDLIMPLMNGYQVMRCLTLSAAGCTPSFVVISALTEASSDVSYAVNETIAYVNKPFHIDSLLAAIQQVCLVKLSSTNAVC